MKSQLLEYKKTIQKLEAEVQQRLYEYREIMNCAESYNLLRIRDNAHALKHALSAYATTREK